MSKSSIAIQITGDSRRFRKSLDKAESKLQSFGHKMRRVGAVATKAMLGIGALAAGVALATKPLVSAASDFEESWAKAGEVFGASVGIIQDEARSAAREVGLSQDQYLEAASNFGMLGIQAGYAGDDLAGFADQWVGLAADVASFNNISLDEAIQKIQSGFAGSAEPLRTVGVFLTENAVKAKAAELGLRGLHGELTEGEKIVAREALMLEQLAGTGAIGDFERTAAGFANQSRVLGASWRNLQIAVGQRLLPVMNQFVGVLLDLVEYGERLNDVFTEQGFTGVVSTIAHDVAAGAANVAQTIRQWGATLWQTFRSEWLPAFVGWVVDAFPRWVSAAWDFVKSVGQWVVDRAVWLYHKVKDDWLPAFVDWVQEVWPGVRDRLVTLAGDIGAWIVEQAGTFWTNLSENWAPAFWNWVQEVLPGLVDRLARVAKAVGSWIYRTAEKMPEKFAVWAEEFSAWFEDNDVADKLAGNVQLAAAVIAEEFVRNAPKIVLGIKITSTRMELAWAKGLARITATLSGMAWDMVWALNRPFVNLGHKIWALVSAAWDFVRNKVANLNPINLPGINWGNLVGGAASWVFGAEGGIVTRPTLAVIGEAGPEAVVPLSSTPGSSPLPTMGGGGGGMTVHVHMPAGADAEAIVETLRRYERRNGSLPLLTRTG